MKKIVLLPTRSQWVAKILNGEKTIEIRKRVLKCVLEELAKGNTVEFHLYCTKAKPNIYMHTREITNPYFGDTTRILNGLVVAKFEVKKIDEIKGDFELDQMYGDCDGELYIGSNPMAHWAGEKVLFTSDIAQMACINELELYEYLVENRNKVPEIVGYAIHIDNLTIFDRPRELREYYKDFVQMDTDQYGRYVGMHEFPLPITHAPQSMMTAYVEV